MSSASSAADGMGVLLVVMAHTALGNFWKVFAAQMAKGQQRKKGVSSYVRMSQATGVCRHGGSGLFETESDSVSKNPDPHAYRLLWPSMLQLSIKKSIHMLEMILVHYILTMQQWILITSISSQFGVPNVTIPCLSIVY